MFRASKPLKIVVFTLLTAALLMAVINLNVPTVKAQTQDTLNMITSIGGTTDPAGGTSTNYTDGTTVTITATPGLGFLFLNWEIASAAGGSVDSDNPLSLTLNESAYDVQAVFQPVTYVTPASPATAATNAIVVVIAGVGGTTSPAPGTYSLANAASLDLTATPDSGFVFDHWVIAGTPMNGHGGYSFTDTPTNNPYNVNHGYGNTYSYEAVFSPVSTSSSPTINEFSSATAILMAAILVLVAFGTYAFTKRTKK